MSRLVFAILAHNNRPCLRDLVNSLRKFSPGSKIILFNGGRDAQLDAGLGVEVCPYSTPLIHGKLADFQMGIMRSLHEQRIDYDFLVTLDSDMLLIKPGLESFLETSMARSSFMGVRFQEIHKGTDWDIGRRFMFKWGKFQQALGIETPFGCFNPGQVYRRDYVERVIAFKNLDLLFQLVHRSRLDALEEIVYASLAVALDCNPISNPGSHGIILQRHGPLDLRNLLSDSRVFFIHKVGMDADLPDRQYLCSVLFGDESPSFEDLVAQWDNESGLLKKRGLLQQRTITKLKDLYQWLMPS